MTKRDTNLAEPLKPQLGMNRCYAPLIHGSLFSGIGGFDLAAEWAGWQNAFHCEWNEFGQKILKHYWPNAKSYGDITQTDFTIWRNRIDVLTGGFPCQPYSLAGKRKGKEDDRHLWPEMLRAIREIQPGYIVGENVIGLVNWDGGLVFNEVQTDLENEGYEIQPIILPACSINAPHRRERVWFVAYSSNKRCNNRSDNWQERYFQSNERTTSENKPEWNGRKCRVSEVSSINTNAESEQGSCIKRECSEQEQGELRGMGIEANVFTNPECERQQEQRQPERPMYTKENREWKASWAYDDGRWPTQSPICGRNDGFPYRVDRLKALGNAIVPQVALQIFKAINMHEAFLSGA